MSQRRARQARRLASAAPPKPRARFQSSRREWWIAGVSVVLAGALIAGIVIARDNRRPAQANAAVAAPKGALELSGTDPVTGKHVDLADFAGKPVVLNVWGSWCPGCNEEASDLARFARAHPGVQVIGIDLEDTSAGARGFYRRWGWKHPSIADPHGEIASRLGVTGTPTTFFLDARHRVVTQIVGASDLAGFDRGLKAATGRS